LIGGYDQIGYKFESILARPMLFRGFFCNLPVESEFMGGNTDVWVQQICPEVRIYEDDGHLQKQAVPTLLFFFYGQNIFGPSHWQAHMRGKRPELDPLNLSKLSGASVDVETDDETWAIK
jgi:hypothetical protein